MARADEMVDQAFDPKQQDVVARAIEQLSPEEAQYFLDRLERAIRKRRLQLGGYLAAMLVWLVLMVVALYIYGTAAEGDFVAWAFVMPFGAVGVILWAFGRAAEKIGKSGAPTPAIVAAKKNKANADPKAGAAVEVVDRPPPDAKSGKPE
jgi:lipopolysaccharide export LptBFGC system permease protein LptF